MWTCAVDSLISAIPAELLNNADTTQGIGRTAFNLRSPLGQSHPCAAPGVGGGGAFGQ